MRSEPHYVLRVIMDTEEDVFRDLALPRSASLMDLHHAIVESFDLEAGEMSSFFVSNEHWEQGREISMMDYDPMLRKNALEKQKLPEVLQKVGDRLLFAYDFLNLWTFFLEVMEVTTPRDPERQQLVILRQGERPAEAPPKDHDPTGVDPADAEEDFEDYNDDDDDDLWG